MNHKSSSYSIELSRCHWKGGNRSPFGRLFLGLRGGMIFDYTGGYRSVFILSVITSALAVLCMALMREKRHSAEYEPIA